MKILLTLLTIIIITSCGPSSEEQERFNKKYKIFNGTYFYTTDAYTIDSNKCITFYAWVESYRSEKVIVCCGNYTVIGTTKDK